jgi:hypothetical protein
MRVWLAVLVVACTGPVPEAPSPPEPTRRPLAELPETDAVVVWPRVELVPENGLSFHVVFAEPVSLGGHDFSVYRVDGDQAVEVVGALPRWHWNEPRLEVRLEPKGLLKRAPYVLVGEALTTDDGRAIPSFAHRFRVMPPDVTPPDGSRIRVLGAPDPGTTAGLRIPFDEPVGRDAVRKVAALAGGQGWPGVWSLSADQRELRFEPSQPWPDALVVVAMNAGIRDLAGNELADRPQGMLVPMVPVEP